MKYMLLVQKWLSAVKVLRSLRLWYICRCCSLASLIYGVTLVTLTRKPSGWKPGILVLVNCYCKRVSAFDNVLHYHYNVKICYWEVGPTTLVSWYILICTSTTSFHDHCSSGMVMLTESLQLILYAHSYN